MHFLGFDASGITIDLSVINSLQTVSSGNLEITLNNGAYIEDVYGTDDDDTITGNGLANKLIGNDGDDTIRGGDGDDDLWGDVESGTSSPGDDLDGEGGSDTIDGVPE